MLTMLFVRDYTSFTGGHLKSSHYLGHAAAFPGIEPILYLTGQGRARADNPFLATGARRVERPVPADIYFAGGLDWEVLDAAGIDTSNRPVVNLIQHLRHADPTDPRYRYLSRSALRICVSPEVAQAVSATGRANGPVVTIENGLDLDELPLVTRQPEPGRVFVAGWKNPDLARDLAHCLRSDLHMDLADGQIPRPEFLDRMARAEIAVTLPHAREGFFLPALEAMALGIPVIVPDCGGNRSFCRDQETCLMPEPHVEALAHATLTLAARPELRAHLRANGSATAREHSLDRERTRFHAVLADHLGHHAPKH